MSTTATRRGKNSVGMARALLMHAFAVVVLFSLPCSPAREIAAPADSLTLNTTLLYLVRTMEALKGALHFFQRNDRLVNLDAVIGTRIVEGSLKVLLRNINETGQTERLPAEVTSDMRNLYLSSKDVSDAAEPHVAQSESLYYHRIGPVIHEGLWELNYPMRTLPSSVPLWQFSPEEAMTESQSDDCLTEFFGTGDTKEKCVISEKCWKRMTTFGYSQYSLSHQIFYLQIGELSGCTAHIIWNILMHNQPGMHVLQDTFCANMLREAQDFQGAGLPAVFQDLFMEQGALCGMYGYYEFFRFDWLEQILGWQDPQDGCYKWSGWPLDRNDRKNFRVKREERRLDNGCLCHRTTVAAAALVQYVRFLTEAYLEQAAQQLESL